MELTPYFEFETDFVEALRCIPMIVRFKLDTCGVKLKLAHWNQLNQHDRQALVDRACTTPAEITAYHDWLHDLIRTRSSLPATDLAIELNPDWHNHTMIPTSVIEKAASVAITISLQEWQMLTPIQRFALIKLSRSGHENNNFLPALQEFGLVGLKES